VVDDDPVMQLMLFRQLAGLGHTVQTLASVEQAVSAIRSQDFGLIFLDLQLPDGNGMEAARLIRTAGVATPMIGLTAHSDARYRDACLQTGMADCLAKPVGIGVLRALLSQQLAMDASA
jgi:two-component system sensor histidine kinase EvgS